MASKSHPALIAALRSTLDTVEKSEEATSDDRAVRYLKSNVLRTLAELEIKRNEAEPEPGTPTKKGA